MHLLPCTVTPIKTYGGDGQMETSEQPPGTPGQRWQSMSKVPTDCCKCQSVILEQQPKQTLSVMKLTVKTSAVAYE